MVITLRGLFSGCLVLILLMVVSAIGAATCIAHSFSPSGYSPLPIPTATKAASPTPTATATPTIIITGTASAVPTAAAIPKTATLVPTPTPTPTVAKTAALRATNTVLPTGTPRLASTPLPTKGVPPAPSLSLNVAGSEIVDPNTYRFLLQAVSDCSGRRFIWEGVDSQSDDRATVTIPNGGAKTVTVTVICSNGAGKPLTQIIKGNTAY